jgi:hypothetical protein
LLDKEPSNKINFNEEYYNSRNNSPINIDEKDIDVEDINVSIGGKKRKYKKRK